MSAVEPAVAEVLRQEGDYVDDPQDTGGATRFGISQRQYPDLVIRDLTEAAAAAIYRRDYWTPMRLAEVEDQAVATALLVLGVHVGVRQAVRLWQEALHRAGLAGVIVDGLAGPQTLQATSTVPARELLPHLRLETIAYYLRLRDRNPAMDRFFAGWVRRALTT